MLDFAYFNLFVTLNSICFISIHRKFNSLKALSFLVLVLIIKFRVDLLFKLLLSDTLNYLHERRKKLSKN